MSNKWSTSRRDFLRKVSIGIATPAIKYSDTTELYHNPPPSAQRSIIPLDETGPLWVRPDEWPVHTFGYITEGDEGTSALERVRSSASYTFQLDNTEVTDFHQGWTGVHRTDTDDFEHKWRYSVPPLPAGEHEFSLLIRFPEPIRTPGNPDRVWEGEYRFEGTYTVTSDPPQDEVLGRKPSDTDPRDLRTIEIDDSDLVGGY